MKVVLAGYNIDTNVINDLLKHSPPRNDVTPETLSAAYARISRDPRSVDELRRLARQEVDKARRSNKTIIFTMGHHSVAEHAVFNFDLIGVSRLAIEELEHFRLCSFTEKSQRYITLENDFVIPAEIEGTALESKFTKMIREQNNLYHRLYQRLKEYTFNKYLALAQDPKQHLLLDGWAKEDARYVTALATEGQLGETINARNLELLLRRFASHPLAEVRELGNCLYQLVEKVAPSIILFHQANDYDAKTYPALREAVAGWSETATVKNRQKDDVSLVSYQTDGDNLVLAALLHTACRLPYSQALQIVRRKNPKEKKKLIKTTLQHMELYDAAPREFEYANFTYGLTISASCFAQLKRHRQASLIVQEYDPALGVTIPESIKEIGMEKELLEIIKKTEDVYYQLKDKVPLAAPYILTNAHRRRVLFSCNARELYHISRLREDKHAQWDIRRISSKMSALAKEVMPITMLLICGKDSYPQIYKEVFKKLPKVVEV